MAITAKAREITQRVYDAYGSDSGMLLDIPSDKRLAVEVVVQAVIEFLLEDVKENYTNYM